MNNQITLTPNNYIPYTLVPNYFIDNILRIANGEFVKVYLVLLRFLGNSTYQFNLSDIADHLLITEKDVSRALHYFSDKNLLRLVTNGATILEIILLTPGEVDSHSGLAKKTNSDIASADSEQPIIDYATKPNYSSQDVTYHSGQKEFKNLLYITEKYLGKTLNVNDVKTIIGLNTWLKLPLDVIESLIEHCVSHGHRHMNYIEKVAIEWAEKGITTSQQVKTQLVTYNDYYYPILKAYGIKDRAPIKKEIDIIEDWKKKYKFDKSLLIEACQRTIMAINKPSFNYTTSILENWHRQGIQNLSQLNAFDAETKSAKPSTTSPSIPLAAKPTKKFANFDQRHYDYDELEKKALKLRLEDSKKLNPGFKLAE